VRGHIHRRASRDRAGHDKVLWYVVIDVGRGADGRRRQRWHGSYPSRHAAEAARAEIINRWYQGTYVEPSSTTLEEWVRRTWLPSMQTRVKPSTWDSYRRNFELHLLPRLGHRPLQKLAPGALNAAYDDLLHNGRRTGAAAGLSATTVRYLHMTLHKALSDAVDAGMLTRNPADRAKPPRPDRTSPRELRTWTPDQLRQFLASVAGARLGTAWHLAALTGLRRGEVLGLRWADTDLDAARLTVRHTIISVAYEIQDSTPKTHKARMVDLDARTVVRLRQQLECQEAERQEWGEDYLDHDLVFCRENGTPLHPDTFSQCFARAVAETDLPRLRLHDLTHTHASVALRAGIPLKVVSERLGHSSPEYTMRQYAHCLPGMQAEAASQIAALVLDGSNVGPLCVERANP